MWNKQKLWSDTLLSFSILNTNIVFKFIKIEHRLQRQVYHNKWNQGLVRLVFFFFIYIYINIVTIHDKVRAWRLILLFNQKTNIKWQKFGGADAGRIPRERKFRSRGHTGRQQHDGQHVPGGRYVKSRTLNDNNHNYTYTEYVYFFPPNLHFIYTFIH